MPSPAVSMHVDASQFQAKAKRLLRQLKITEKDFVKEQGQLYALDLAKATPPHAGGRISLRKKPVGTAADKKTGEHAVRSDYRRAVRTLGPARYWKNPSIKKAIRAGDTQTLQGMVKHFSSRNQNLKVTGFSNRLHKSARNRRGRVPKGHTGVIALPHKEVQTGMRKAVSRVGIAKAGLARCAQRLGHKGGLPKWVARHTGKVTAYASLSKNLNGWRARFGATAAGHQHTAKSLRFVARYRQNLAVKSLQAKARHAVKKSGFRTL